MHDILLNGDNDKSFWFVDTEIVVPLPRVKNIYKRKQVKTPLPAFDETPLCVAENHSDECPHPHIELKWRNWDKVKPSTRLVSLRKRNNIILYL